MSTRPNEIVLPKIDEQAHPNLTQSHGELEQENYTPPQLAKIFGSSPETIIALIRSGDLPAVNFSTGQRPRYRVLRGDWEAFLARRKGNNTTNAAIAPKTRTRHSQSAPRRPGEVTQFI